VTASQADVPAEIPDLTGIPLDAIDLDSGMLRRIIPAAGGVPVAAFNSCV
jgi:hypothetical protein